MRNQAFSSAKQQRPAYLSDPRPAITPEGSDVVVTKRRVSASTGRTGDDALPAFSNVRKPNKRPTAGYRSRKGSDHDRLVPTRTFPYQLSRRQSDGQSHCAQLSLLG
jgi:hypothetical protein